MNTTYVNLFGIWFSTGQLVLLFLITCLLAFIPSRVAAKKGRSAVGWYIFGVAFLGLAIISAVVVKPLEGYPQGPQLTRAEHAERRKKLLLRSLATLGAVALIVVAVVVVRRVGDTRQENANVQTYAEAGLLAEAGDYDGAYQLYSSLGEYGDAREQAKKSRREQLLAEIEAIMAEAKTAEALLEAEEPILALFNLGYMDSASHAQSLMQQLEEQVLVLYAKEGGITAAMEYAGELGWAADELLEELFGEEWEAFWD